MSRVVDDISASGSVRNGKLFIRNRRAFDQQIEQMRDGVEVEVSVTIRRAARSQQANAYYWGVVIEEFHRHTTRQDMGYTPEDLHDICKAKFLPKRLSIVANNGEIAGDYVLGGSTRSLNTTEFYEYVERVRQWLAELGIYTPDPGEPDDYRTNPGYYSDDDNDPIYRAALTGGK